MKAFLKWWSVRALALLLAASAASAQDRVPFRQEELDQMLAPIALYPDPLLSQMLMASTYPLEVVQAARWSKANPGLKGQEAVRAVEAMNWDPSVKSLTAFPDVLATMDQKLEWTERLGEAFLAQQADVMDTVQALRRRAEARGNLPSNEHTRVVREGEAIVIEPPAPETVYVPYYNPTVVYGPWWWPSSPPVYWAPPPGYYAVPAYGPTFYWGPAIGFAAGFFFGHFDWHHHHIKVAHAHHPHAGHPTTVRAHWSHNPVHRRGVPFRNAQLQQRFAQQRTAARGNDAARIIERRTESASVLPRPEVRSRQPEIRSTQPQVREQVERRARVAQPDRPLFRPAERRVERPDGLRGQQPAATAPAARSERRAFGPAPIFRAAPQAQHAVREPAPVVRAAPQPQRAVREPAPVVRAAPQPVQRPAPVAQPPRVVTHPQRGNDGARGNPLPRAVERGPGRRS